jgi:hypothetical protein
MQLLSLSVLALTPYEVGLFRTVNMPVLSTFIIYAPKAPPSTAPIESLGAISLFGQRVQNLEFHDWPNSPTFIAVEWTTTSILEHLLSQIFKVKRVCFVKSFVDGRELVDLLNSRLDTDGVGSKKLEVTLDRCEGITRADCEEIQNSDPVLVQSLKIFV